MKETISKKEIQKIKYKEDATIIYGHNIYFVCEPSSVEDWGQCLAFERKGSGEKK